MASEFDAKIGLRIRQRRWVAKMTQSQLADQVGLRFQQIHKYETGQSAMKASTLAKIAKVLGVSIAFFFDEVADYRDSGSIGAEAHSENRDLLEDRQSAALLVAFQQLPSESRMLLLNLATTMTKRPQTQDVVEALQTPPLRAL